MIKKTILIISLLVLSFTFLFSQTQVGGDIDGVSSNFNLGWSVSMPNSNLLLVGEPGYVSNKGRAMVYEWDGYSWSQKGSSAIGEDTGDKFGTAVSMPDESTFAVGGYLNDANDPINNNYGHVRVYQWISDNWAQKGADIDGENPNDLSGQAISMGDANTIAIGAPDNSWAGPDAGHVRVFEWSGLTWDQKGIDIDGGNAGDNFGFSVSMADANTVAISAINNDDGASNAGLVQVYEWNSTAWVQKGADFVGENEDDKIGTSVCMPDANHLAIGSHMVDANGVDAGLVRIYEWNGSAWIQMGSDIVGEAAGDLSGFSVSMPDINTIAIGSNNSDNGAIPDVGNARMFSWNGSDWEQTGSTIYGESSYDYSGRSVSMPNANVIAIGSALNDGGGNNAGHARVYSLCEPVTGTDVVEECEEYTWIDGITYYDNNNTATHTIIGGAANGCDSVVTLNLTLNESATGVDIVSGCEEFTWIDGITYYDDNFTATHTIIDGAVNGCDSIVTLNLTMNFVTFGTDVVTGCNEYTWIDGITYYGNNYTATHTIEDGNSNMCDSIVTLNLTMNYVDITVSQDNLELSSNQDGGEYQWLDCNDDYSIIADETSQIFTATENGSYAVRVTNGECVDTSDCVDITNVGLFANRLNDEIVIYPNPTSGLFTVQMQEKCPYLKLEVTDITGRVVISDFYNNAQIIDVELKEPAGIYFIRFDTATETTTLKLLKE
jgi:hypothetical protein